MTDRTTLTPRARARVQTTEQIKQIARAHLAAEGPNLSLRAVARDLGVVSSAVYRYFASRDELLTALIIDGYEAMGEAAEQAEAAIARRDLSGRWFALGRAVRTWSRERPHEYALLYGTPVPGYAAPPDTIVAAQRPLTVAMNILGDGAASGAIAVPADRLARAVRADVEKVQTYPGFELVPVALLARGMSAWALLFGTISFELFGRFNNAIDDLDAYYEHQLRVTARHLGLL
jgi:AcrR family transcriptional regulator